MMRSIVVVASCLLGIIGYSSARSFEVDQNDAPCIPANEVSRFLFENYKEFPVMVFSSDKVKYVLFVSDNPKGWTLVGMVDDKIACIVSEGSDWLANKRSLDQLQR